MPVDKEILTVCPNGHTVSLIEPKFRFPSLDNAKCGDVVTPERWCKQCQSWVPGNLPFRLYHDDLLAMRTVNAGFKRGKVSIMDGIEWV